MTDLVIQLLAGVVGTLIGLGLGAGVMLVLWRIKDGCWLWQL